MGVEYEAPIAVSAATLFDALAADPHWRVVRRTDDALGLALAAGGSTWPEDIGVQVTAGRLYIVVHAGTATQRREFLDAVAAILERAPAEI